MTRAERGREKQARASSEFYRRDVNGVRGRRLKGEGEQREVATDDSPLV